MYKNPFERKGSFSSFISEKAEELKISLNGISYDHEMIMDAISNMENVRNGKNGYDKMESAREYASKGWDLILISEKLPDGEFGKDYLSHFVAERIFRNGEDGEITYKLVFAEKVPEKKGIKRASKERTYCIELEVFGDCKRSKEDICLTEPMEQIGIVRLVDRCMTGINDFEKDMVKNTLK